MIDDRRPRHSSANGPAKRTMPSAGATITRAPRAVRQRDPARAHPAAIDCRQAAGDRRLGRQAIGEGRAVARALPRRRAGRSGPAASSSAAMRRAAPIGAAGAGSSSVRARRAPRRPPPAPRRPPPAAARVALSFERGESRCWRTTRSRASGDQCRPRCAGDRRIRAVRRLASAPQAPPIGAWTTAGWRRAGSASAPARSTPPRSASARIGGRCAHHRQPGKQRRSRPLGSGQRTGGYARNRRRCQVASSASAAVIRASAASIACAAAACSAASRCRRRSGLGSARSVERRQASASARLFGPGLGKLASSDARSSLRRRARRAAQRARQAGTEARATHRSAFAMIGMVGKDRRSPGTIVRRASPGPADAARSPVPNDSSRSARSRVSASDGRRRRRSGSAPRACPPSRQPSSCFGQFDRGQVAPRSSSTTVTLASRSSGGILPPRSGSSVTCVGQAMRLR